jgi:hypothetical protein
LAVPQALQKIPESPDKNVGSEPPQILAPTADLNPFLSSVSTTSSAGRRLDIQQSLQRVVVGFQFRFMNADVSLQQRRALSGPNAGLTEFFALAILLDVI